MRNSFRDVSFNDKYSLDGVISETFDLLKNNKSDHKHIIITDEFGKIVAGLFNIPDTNTNNDTFYDVGWFFISSDLSKSKRLLIADMMVVFFHDKIKSLGYKKVVTQMGTKSGENLFSKRYGYEKINENRNQWIKIL